MEKPTFLGILVKCCISFVIGMFVLLIVGFDENAGKVALGMFAAIATQGLLDFYFPNM